ncbi:hypothetical protein PFICI_15143 [Pestalotiopsis fici W106-1]|uniref:Methionine permease n=1 Tax=Pestalotiopsis fici (strain W106-1 / CGMCC3.15140) TaxID=1229662 RepID=W3WH28_PESFW|nr:uncharacterized protein PFICI_15143 [Pestalotiopsis fici W106-1]ETS73198.1 hypothetical protein PFICI_15143 [Pestalotiopsis fici W106-1]
MAGRLDDETRPLLTGSSADNSSSRATSRTSRTSKTSNSCSDDTAAEGQPDRLRLEDDVLTEDSVLGRNIGWTSAYILAISRVIGGGIFAVPGVVLKSVGSVGMALSLWVLGALVTACALAVSLEYGCMLPRSGGDKVYLEFTYSRPRFLASTIVATQAILLSYSASNCIIFSQYVHWALDLEPRDLSRKLLAAALVTVVAIVHGCFYKIGIRIQNLLGWVKVGLVTFMVFAALYVVLFKRDPNQAGEAVDATGPWNDLWDDTDWSLGTIATSLFKIFNSYTGLDNLNYVLNEVRDPVRTLKSVSITALLSACLLYLLTNLAYVAVVPVQQIKESGQLVAALFFEQTFGKNVGKRFLPLVVALSAAGNVMVVTFALARLNQEVARQGFLPFARLLSSSKPFGAPLGGLIIHYIPTVLVIVLPPTGDVYSFILEVEGYPRQFFALLTSFGILWLRYKRPDLKRPFRAWIAAVVFRMLLGMMLLAAPFFPPKERQEGGIFYATYAIVGTSIIGCGVIYWLIWTVILPRIGNYHLEEKEDTLDDGTKITFLDRVPNQVD